MQPSSGCWWLLGLLLALMVVGSDAYRSVRLDLDQNTDAERPPPTQQSTPPISLRLPLLSRRRWQRKNAPVVSLPRLDSAFQLKPKQKLVQAQGWRESLIAMGNQLISQPIDPPLRAQKETIRSIAESLETTESPTPRPALSKLSNGSWKCLYTDAPGPSGGKLGPFVGRVYQDVDMDEKQYVNILKVGMKGSKPWLEAKLIATWEVVDDETWEVKFEHVQISAWGKQVLFKRFGDVRRIWKITYLDQQLRIMRARRPEKREDQAFLFVLQRDNGLGR
jgi:hypothetical protein